MLRYTTVVQKKSHLCVIYICLQEDYDELLKYAIVVPTYNPANMLRTTLPEVKSTASTASAPPLSAAATSTVSDVMHRSSFATNTASSATAQKPNGTKNGLKMKAQILGQSHFLWSHQFVIWSKYRHFAICY